MGESCAGRAPVPIALLARALGASGFEVRERLMRLGALLNVRRADSEGGDGDTVALFIEGYCELGGVPN